MGNASSRNSSVSVPTNQPRRRSSILQTGIDKLFNDKKELKQFNNTHFTLQELSKLQKAFKLNKDPTGDFISKTQFVKILQEHVTVWSTGAHFIFLERLFNAFDNDNSGTIEFDEFINGLSVFLKGTPEEKVELTFKLYDIDKSGSIEPAELIRIMGQMYAAFVSEERVNQIQALVERIFLDLDIDDKGSLTMTEFKLMALKEPIIVDFLSQFVNDEDDNEPSIIT